MPNKPPRTTIARHAHLPTPSALSTLLKLFGIVVAVLTVSAVAVVAFVAADVLNRVDDHAVALETTHEIDPPSLGAYDGDKAFNVMIIGTDECGETSTALLGKRCSDPQKGILNDVNILVHVSAEPRNVTAISLPRDLEVPVPQCTREDGSTASAQSKAPLNSVYGRAGLACVVKTVSELGGIPIDFAAKISFDGVMAVTDAIGGVEVCIAGEGIRDRQTAIDWPPGNRVVSGLDALLFLRTRYGVGDGSDLSRISNQQQYMSRLARKVLSEETLTDIPKSLRLADAIADNIVPSESLSSPLRLAQLGLALKDVPFDDFVFVQYPTGADPSNKNKVVPDQQAAAALWAAIKSGQPLQLTGDVASHRGVEAAPPPAAAAPTPDPSASAADPTAAAPEPQARASLPPEISGQTLAQDTCSNGRQN